MRLLHERTGEILVARDPVTSRVELRIEGSAEGPARSIQLTGQEARRLAALILFQAARLERPAANRPAPYIEAERQSA